ncbi:unnamed protein product [Vicia faba]|uniref:Protein kinase domain-containing protein n=1 Tax=Vicia faba TaxID=3906 RepID=A0AAV0YP83_VICFA|nr:unnamed protein product [Vicia faba]
MDDYTREMMDLKTLVTRTLEKKGVLARIRAELRASVIPLKAQVPPCDVFSKKVMSNFLGSRKVTSPDYIDYRIKRAKCLPQFKNMAIRGLQGNLIVSNGAIVGPDSLNGSAHVDYPSGEAGFGVGGNGKLVNGNTSSSGITTVNGFSQGELHYTSNADVSGIVNNDNVTTKTQIVEDGTVKAQLSLHDEELRTIEGDMCASSTGVVRVQSRKKAEMFLVRTDGFSCTREKVTESSLAFTHPSTQQQMLMWKSTPKNVLLLKKLGDELLEEAKMEAIEEEDRVIEKDQALLPALLGSCNDRAKQLHASPSGRLLTALVCEYLDWAQLIWRSVGTPFTATTEAGTSSASSSDPGTSPFCIPEMNELLLHQQSSQRNGERSEAYHGMPQATTTKALLEKYSRLDRGAGMEMSAAYRNDSDFSGNLREAIALSGNAPLGPPPLCSICQHKAPVFGKPPRWFNYAELELATGGFSQANFLAEGGYGSVHRGVLPEGQVIAVKQHKLASSQEDKRRLLVYEYICNGSLDSHLYGRQRDPLEWSARQKIAVGAARGLRYLHEECRVGCIIHRDMRPNNILITHDFEPLVGDFGLARWQPDGDMGVDTRVIGTFGYLAPEYAQSGQITEKADVYSFGVVLVELVTGRKAVDLTRPKGQQCLTEWARPLLEEYAIDELIDPRLGRLYLEHEVYCMLHAASLCIRRDPHCRPRMSQVLRILEGDMVMDTNYISTPGYDVGNRSGRIWSEPLQRQHHYSGPLLEDSLESSFSGKLSRDKYKPFFWDRSRDKP